MTIAEKLKKVADNEQRVFNSGVEVGGKLGMQLQYDEFWDAFQQGGNRKIYSNCFNGGCWNAETLKPKYLIKPIDETATSQYGVSMFYRANESNTERLDFSAIADKFDFSGLTMATSLFSSAYFTNVIADLSNAHTASLAFANQWYGAIDKLTLKVSEKLTTATNIFYGNFWLNELTMMEGSVIACDGWDLHWATALSKNSITNIINALSTSTSGKTLTLSKTAVNTAFETTAGVGDGEASTAWISLEQSRSNWTISLM